MSFKLTLIRHGRTEANEKKVYGGCNDVPVTEGGLEELREKISTGIYEESELYFTSNLYRTEQTLYLIFGEVAHKKYEGLKEMDFGDFSFRSYDQLKEVKEYIEWITDESGDYICPGGESRNGFCERVMKAFNELTEEIDKSGVKSAVLVSHGGVMGTIIQNVFKEEGTFFDYVPSNGCGYILNYEDGKYSSYHILK